MADRILQVENLTKNYGVYCAVDTISFSVTKGNIVGFLGPNGAGKTTTIQMLLGITLANGGQITYFGKDFYKHKEACLQRINFTSAFNTLLGRISVWENLLVYAGLYKVKDAQKKITDLLEQFEIAHLKSERYWDLSSGQKTRVNLVKSLLNDPEILLMDEPTASLDPDIADKTLSFIEEMKKSRNLSILYTSHNMDEITRICDEVIFLDHGKIVAQDTPVNLTKRIAGAKLRLIFDADKKQMETYLKEHRENYTFLNNYLVEIKTQEKLIPKLIFDISKTNIPITDIEILKPTLEDVFIQIARSSI